MQSCRAGSPDAFEQIFERHRTAVWGFFRRRVAERSRAEDLAQETFVALLKSVPRYEPRDQFRSYLFGIAYHVLADWRRKTPVATGDIDAAGLTAVSADLDTVLMVRQAIAALDAIDREVLMLREFEALPYADIAVVLTLPVNTVRSRLFRARMALKEKLQ